ncbi:MAG TPA: hypothetical protein VF399_08235 [bacterium]
MKIAKTAPDALKILWQNKFFIKGKTLNEVEEELHNKGYNFGDATRKALERADFLLSQGKRGDRKFLQKYPYIEEETDAKRKRNE